MLDSASQWNLLADCAKDWGFAAEMPKTESEPKPQFSLRELADSLRDEDDDDAAAAEIADMRTGQADLVHYAVLSEQEEKALLHDLMANPKNATLWQLCLMGYSRENIAQYADSLESPLQGVEAWLMEGIKKGWLRRQERHYDLTVLEYPLFVHRLERDCQLGGGVFTLGLVKIRTSDLVRDILLQSCAAHLSVEDYLCNINGLGYALVFWGRKNFAASAVMEKILDNLEQNLHREHIAEQFSAGLSEYCRQDTAEALLDHAKQALSMPSPAGIRVKSYINRQQTAENNSLVHSNEKRFLFFGVQ